MAEVGNDSAYRAVVLRGCDVGRLLVEDGGGIEKGHHSMARDEAGPILNGIPSRIPDIDPDETQEWLDSLDAVIDEVGRTRARYVMRKLLERARERQVGVPSLTATNYINTIDPEAEPWFPGDEDVERRYRAFIRWNAAIIVHRAQRPGIGVGGHISSYASAATWYEVGFNHCFRGRDHEGGGDQIYG